MLYDDEEEGEEIKRQPFETLCVLIHESEGSLHTSLNLSAEYDNRRSNCLW